MDLLWTVFFSILAAIGTTLVLNFFLQRMTENAKKPWLTNDHEALLKMLDHPNAVATVQWPNGRDKNYDVSIMENRLFQLKAFDEMVENKILVPIPNITDTFRLSCNHMSKYRKRFGALVQEEFLSGWFAKPPPTA
jgi:hypothetical protein